jgi:capsule polysaccharide export protein KpsC/LpsZ
MGYYKRLKKIPNVKLIACNANTKELIEYAERVITLTSTVGFEALMMNKPVYVFGNVFYECHPNCRKIVFYEELYDKLCDLTVNNAKSLNRRFIYAYTKIAYPGNIYYSISTDYEDDFFTTPFISALNKRFC